MEKNFFSARERVLSEATDEGGIGTLGEKLVHKVLKYCIEPDEDFHERKLFGSVADIFDGERVVEIQTRAFIKLVPKLRKFLAKYPVTVVYPLIRERKIRYFDRETGRITPPRKSPRRGRLSDALVEISAVREFFGTEGFSIKIVVLDAEEYRKKGGISRGRRARENKLQIIPTDLVGTVDIATVGDYFLLLPEGLADTFTADAFYKALGLRGMGAYFALDFLREMKIIKQIGKQGRAYLYEINKEI